MICLTKKLKTIIRQGDHYSIANYSGSLVNYLYKKYLKTKATDRLVKNLRGNKMEVQITTSSMLAGIGVTSGTRVGGNECSQKFSYVPCNRTSMVKSFL